MSNNGHDASSVEGATQVVCQSAHGFELRGIPLRLAPHLLTFEVYHPSAVLQLSEVLSPLQVVINGHTLFSGRAVLTSVVRTGGTLICEANLGECWLTTDSLQITSGIGVHQHFKEFLGQWQQWYKILPEYKVLISDLETFLSDLRLWLQQVELSIRASPVSDRVALEREVAGQLGDQVVGAVDAMWHRFETVIEKLDPELHTAYAAYLRRQLHPLLLCSPFAYRSFHKPLGYAGDYEMVNMIARDPLEGGSLFAKLVNLWLWRQPPAEAHRNRLTFLETKLTQETARVAAGGRSARIFNVACGPALEVQRFLAKGLIADSAEFTLLDFNEETIAHARAALADSARKHQRRTPIRLIKKSVHQILKEGGLTFESKTTYRYDLVYCAGLFDYLSDPVCQRLIQIFCGWLAPEGLLLVTNVEASKHFQCSLEFILDWHLVYRNRMGMEKIVSGVPAGFDTAIWTDTTGVNLFAEIRKPKYVD